MKRILVACLFLLVFVSCSIPKNQNKTIHPTSGASTLLPLAMDTEILKPSMTPSPTPSTTPSKQIPTISATAELFTSTCLDIGTTLFDKPLPAYSLVFTSNRNKSDSQFIFSFNNVERVAIQEAGSPQSTSYDGNWLAYVNENFGVDSQLVLQNSDRTIQRRIPIQNNWLFSFPWVDENLIYINVMDSDIPDVLVLNALTGEQTLLKTNYPNIMPFEWFGGSEFHFGLTSVIYDPSLELVIYRKTLEQGGEFRHFITLYNTITKEELASIEDEPYFRYPFRTPVWSVDGQEVIVASHIDYVSELYRIDRAGHVSQLTRFRNRYIDLKIGEMSLSPDKKSLVFWAISSEDPIEGQLFLLDMKTNKLFNLCFTATEKYGGMPIWSPDSLYFVVSGSSQTILVNAARTWAVQLPVNEEAYPVGWLKQQ